MPRKQSPSEMLVHLNDALEKVLPEPEYEKLVLHDAQIAKTTNRGDFHRCFRCAEWTVELVGKPEHAQLRHLGRELEAVVHEFHDTDWAVAFGAKTPGRIITDVELTWVDDAVKAATEVAQTSGWGAVPWEQLLIELIAIEPSEN